MPTRKVPAELPPGTVEHRRRLEVREQRRRHAEWGWYTVNVYRYTCACGWRSHRQPTEGQARRRADLHNRDGQLGMDWGAGNAAS